MVSFRLAMFKVYWFVVRFRGPMLVAPLIVIQVNYSIKVDKWAIEVLTSNFDTGKYPFGK